MDYCCVGLITIFILHPYSVPLRVLTPRHSKVSRLSFHSYHMVCQSLGNCPIATIFYLQDLFVLLQGLLNYINKILAYSDLSSLCG
uniref:Uncharacterized protein n=1 Tax=Nelumbo nucifera TaxID=4432 RepID=A0A822XX14_NELNU|nr:TPA_asm: hypothetical protein HUJ06_026324 [Nelumbo nucifera]